MQGRSLFAGCLIVCSWVGSVAIAGNAAAQIASTSTPAARITQPIDESNLVVLKGNTHPMAQARFDLGPAPQSMATGRIFLVLRRSATQDEALKSYLASLQDSSSPNYRHWLTPAQFGANFGVGDADLQTIEQWLQSHGLKIEKVPQGRNVIQFSGTIGQVQTTFHTTIHSFQINGEKHMANSSDPSIPAALGSVVQGIARLNDLHPKAQNQAAAPGTYAAATKSIKPSFTLFNGTTPYLYTDPADAATMYDTPNATLNPNYSGTTYDGTGVNIGIAGDSNLSLTDVTNYRVAFLGETATTANIPTVVVDGNDPGINGDEPESLLDNEIAGGLAPKAKIYFYVSSDTDLQSGLFDAIFRAVDDNTVSILNISFGECEAGFGAATNAVMLEVNEQAAAQGISVVVSSGDSGSAGCDSSGASAAQYGLAVNAIASTPFNIAVGGTDFDVLTNSFATYADATSSGVAPYYRTAISYIPEEPWNDSTYPNTTLANNTPVYLGGSTNVIAGGGGASAVYAKPPFQSALTPTDSARDLPDVAFLAGNGLYSASWVVCADSAEYGADCQTSNGQFIDGARFSGYGGTSAAAPAFSGILALVEQKVGSRLGQANYVLYQLAQSKYASVFHDITTGNNSVYCVGGTSGCGGNSFMTGYDAVTGYDQASGLGSVDAANMVSNWSSVALSTTTVAFSINGSTSPVNVTHGTNLTFNVGVTPTTAAGVAAIVDTANEISGGVQNNGQLPITLSSGFGSAVYNGLPGGTYTVYASYSGDTSDAASTSTPAINVTVNPEASTTALTVSSYNPLTGTTTAGGLTAVPYGSQVFLDASIYGTAEGQSGTTGIATGTVTFADGSTTLGQTAVSSSNSASYPALTAIFPAFAIGSHSLTGKYSGDPSYNADTSAPVGITVIQNTSSVVASASATSIPSVGSSTLSITVSAPSLGLGPTGTVVLSANGKTITTLTVVPAIESIPALSTVKYTVQGSSLVSGSNTITMTYSGDANYIDSTGTVVISVTPSKFTLTNNGPISIAAGATSGNTATVTASPTNNFVGVINFSCAVTTVPAGAVSPATCAFPATLDITSSSGITGAVTVATTANTTPGAYAVTVTGTDAATGQVTASTVVNVTVTATPSFALANSGNVTIAAGATSGNTSTIMVTPAGGFMGSVSLACAVTTSVPTPNDPPTCSLPTSVSVTGPTAVTATLTVSTTATTTAAMSNPFRKLYGPAGGILAAFAMFFGIPTKRRRWSHLAAFLSVFVFSAALGCGGSQQPKTIPGTTAGTYVVTITATSTSIASQTTTVSVTVN